MTPLSLAYAAAASRPLQSWMAIIAMAAGVALLCASFLLSGALAQALNKSAQGIDIVVGAKGSPLQLVLSSVYHTDIPVGNIDEHDIEKLKSDPRIQTIIPLVIGDSYKGWRVVGATSDYMSLYKAEIQKGKIFGQPFDVVAGSATGLEVGDEFSASHGLAESGDVHDDHHYTVAGVLKSTGTALDRLLLTQIASVQELHTHHGHEEEAHDEHQVTALLLKVRSPSDLMNLPRHINKSSDLQAAVPAYEMARLSRSLGMGQDVLTAFAIGLIILSALMILSTLTTSLAARRYDIAVLRVLGATPARLMLIVGYEALLLGSAGTVLGLMAGHILAYGAIGMISTLNDMIPALSVLSLSTLDIKILLAGLMLSIIAGLIPALSASRTDITKLLARAKI